MSRKVPKYRLHRGSGQAFVVVNGEQKYLGKYGTEKSKRAYAREVAKLAAGQRTNGPPRTRDAYVGELIAAFWDHVLVRYVKRGIPTTERGAFRRALLPLGDLYADVRTNDFGPADLLAIRARFVADGLCRKNINRLVGRIVRCFKWGVSRHFVPAEVWQSLLSVEGIKRQEMPDNPAVRPVSESDIEAVKPHVSRQVWGLIQLQLWTGCRPDEACAIRGADLKITGPIWEYWPESHKTEHHDKARTIFLGPQAQEAIRPFLRDDPAAYLFDPRDARREWLRSIGKTGDVHFSGKHQPGQRYTSNTYGRAVRNACELAFGMPRHLRHIPSNPRGDVTATDITTRRKEATEWYRLHAWSPNQLRHLAATKIRAAYGIEAARIILGHSSAVTTEIYAEKDAATARTIMAQLG